MINKSRKVPPKIVTNIVCGCKFCAANRERNKIKINLIAKDAIKEANKDRLYP